jgi:hypothetical protein
MPKHSQGFYPANIKRHRAKKCLIKHAIFTLFKTIQEGFVKIQKAFLDFFLCLKSLTQVGFFPYSCTITTILKIARCISLPFRRNMWSRRNFLIISLFLFILIFIIVHCKLLASNSEILPQFGRNIFDTSAEQCQGCKCFLTF